MGSMSESQVREGKITHIVYDLPQGWGLDVYVNPMIWERAQANHTRLHVVETTPMSRAGLPGREQPL